MSQKNDFKLFNQHFFKKYPIPVRNKNEKMSYYIRENCLPKK